MLITGIYAQFSEVNESQVPISISEIASDIQAGEVSSLSIRGEEIIVTYADDTTKTVQKEPNVSIIETFSRLGVSTERLASTTIVVEDPSGFWYWLGQLAPFLAPILFLIFFIWLFSRQVKGAGMQALSFGQSKARITLPNDQKQKVTFKDVAGAKEAKQELLEIVDFLKNPKKFIEIGAEIPKGVLLMGAPGTGKCITGDSLVLTNKGPMRMDEIPKYFAVDENFRAHGVEVVAYNPVTMNFQRVSASHWYDLGIQETRRIKTDSGMLIEGTPEHPVVVVDQSTGCFEFKKLGDLAVGDYAVVGSQTKVFGNCKVLNSDTAYLLGVLTGDGCATVKNRMLLTTADTEILERVQNISKAYLGAEFSKTSSRPYDYELRSVAGKSTLIKWGIRENYAEFKKVPESVMTAPLPVVTGYLKGLFDADGTVERNGAIVLSSASKDLIDNVQALLLNVGIISRKYERKKLYNGKLQFYISIYGDFVQAYRRYIGFGVMKKRNKLDKVCHRQRNTNINIVPHQEPTIRSVWSEALGYTTQYLDRKFYSQSIYKNVKRYISGERRPSIVGLSNFIDGVLTLAPVMEVSSKIDHLQKLSSGHFFFTRVSKVTSGKDRVYDLTVPGLHNFIANGFINHNTLLARAVAGEANVAFFAISGSEFVEMFVGVGASRVRDLFKMAKDAAPSIVFVDEIDAVGRARGTGMGGGNDEREQTLNQILVEMDGFEPNEKVIVMAATNRPDVLDPALLRPGRFDRRVVIDLPDRNDREEILKIHSNRKQLAEDVDLRVVAERTPGFSGADLYSLMNEAAILAARENRTKIGQFDLIRSIEKVMLGPERKSHVLSIKEKEITAYHEAGHAIVASVLPYADPVHKISIISRGRAAGYTLKLPIEDRKLQSRREFLDDIAVSLGGYVAEKMIFGDITTGASNDLQVSTALARNMVTQYGMSDKIGPVAFESPGGRPLFGMGVNDKEYSEKVAAEIDAEVTRIMTEAREHAIKVLNDHKKVFEIVAKRLIEKETIERNEYETIIVAQGIVLKKKPDEFPSLNEDMLHA